MKRILIPIIFILCFLFNAKVLNAETYNGTITGRDLVEGVYFTKIKNGKKIDATNYILKRSTDGQFVYCLEPGVDINNDNKYIIEKTDHAKILKITEAEWEKASLYAYYGYKYGTHTEDKWYSITQYLIWKTISPEVDVYFTKSLGGIKDSSKFKTEIEQLNKLVSNHLILPSFSNQTIKLGIDKEVTLNDTNKVLGNYVLNNPKNAKITVGVNNIKIKPTKAGAGTIPITRTDSRYTTPPIIYTNSTSQNVMAVGSFPKKETKLNIEVIGGKVKIIKIGEELVHENDQYKYNEINLRDVKFELYANEDIYDLNKEKVLLKDELVANVITDENGNAKIDDLHVGKYYLIETESSNNNIITTKKHEFALEYKDKEEYPSFEITIRNHIPKGKIIIKKVDKDTKQVLKDTEFQIFNEKNNTVFKGKTIEDGTVTIAKLPIGKYIIKEIKASEGYKKLDSEKQIEIKHDNDVVNITLENELIPKPKENSIKETIIKVPNTLKEELPILEILCVVLLLMGVVILIYVYKKAKIN